MPKQTILFLAGLLALITSGCIILPDKEILYKYPDIEVSRHESFAVLADSGFISFELTALGHHYRLADWIDVGLYCHDCEGFVRTPDDSAVVFIAESRQKPQAGILTGVVHVIDFKSRSNKEVPLAIKCRGQRFHIFVKSYDGKKMVLFMDSNNTAVTGYNYNVYFSITLEINLDTKQVTEIDHTNNSILK